MRGKFEYTFPVVDGEDGNDMIGRAVSGTAAVDIAGVGDFPRGIVAHAQEDGVGVVTHGITEAYFGAAYDPDNDNHLLTNDANGALKAAVAGDVVGFEYYDGGEVTADEAAAGTAVRRVLVRPPFQLPE